MSAKSFVYTLYTLKRIHMRIEMFVLLLYVFLYSVMPNPVCFFESPNMKIDFPGR